MSLGACRWLPGSAVWMECYILGYWSLNMHCFASVSCVSLSFGAAYGRGKGAKRRHG